MAGVESDVFDVAAELRSWLGNAYDRVSRSTTIRTYWDAREDALTIILNDWPVDTGYSKARWEFAEAGDLRFRLRCDADYAEYVHDGLWVPLVDAAFAEARDTIETEARKILRDLDRYGYA